MSAATLTNLSIAKQVGNSSDLGPTSSGGPPRERKSATETLSSTACSFATRYSQTLDIDVGAFGNTTSISAAADYRIMFSVDADPLEAWTVTIDTRRKGELTIVNDGGNTGTGNCSSVLGGFTGGGSSTGTLSIADLRSVSNSGSPSSDAADSFDKSSVATISGTGPENLSLSFSWTCNVTSVAAGITGGDEAALRMGISSKISSTTTSANNFSAGIYPGPGSRTLDGDGHFVTVRLVGSSANPVIESSTCIRDLCDPSAPCLYRTQGTVACLGDNYHVDVDYLDGNGASICSQRVSVTNGSLEWKSEIRCTCGAETSQWMVTDDPGFTSGPVGDGLTSSEGSILAAATAGTVSIRKIGSTCIPTASKWGLVALVLLLSGAGIFLLARRVRMS